MADEQMIARLAELHEFAELKRHFEERRQTAIVKLGRATFESPEGHDRLEWEKLRAFYRGAEAVLAQPEKARASIKRHTA